MGLRLVCVIRRVSGLRVCGDAHNLAMQGKDNDTIEESAW